MRTTAFSVLLLYVAMSLADVSTAFAQTRCLSLSSSLSYGMTDLGTNGPIYLLQQYLSGAGYLSVVPTGHFGPATLAAVQSFQSANGIANTGYVGPLTQAAVSRLSCAGNSEASVQSAPTVQTQPITTIPVAPAVSALPAPIITAPQGGQTLSTGQTFEITWNTQPYQREDIVLVSSTGAGAGFIAQSIGGVNQYLWTVGTVYSSQSQSNIIVPAGSYQIRIQNSATGAEPTDPISSPFNVAAANLSVSSVFPASVPADGNTAVVLYGSDFNSGVSVSLGNSGAKGQVLYVSPDGKVLVFTIPLGTSAASTSVYVTGNSSGQASNQLPFTILPP